eukprot:18143-Heterococcus_DN1.PRE.6
MHLIVSCCCCCCGLSSTSSWPSLSQLLLLLLPQTAAELRREAASLAQAAALAELDAEVRALQRAEGLVEGSKPGLGLHLRAVRALMAIKKKSTSAARDGKSSSKSKQSVFAASAAALYGGTAATGGDKVSATTTAAVGEEVRNGDASMAAPFTSNKPSVAAVLDVIRQGRFTAAEVLQTYQVHVLLSSVSYAAAVVAHDQ